MPSLLQTLSFALSVRSALAAPATSPVPGLQRRAASEGEFSVLTFNVAGLPQILQGNDVPGDKTTNTATIGKLFAQYNYGIINVQEDFNYHSTLYANDNHPFRTATSGGVPFGSGLNTLSRYPFVDDGRVKWNKCSQASGNDCLTPKGFTTMRLRLDEGVYIDVYNLHTDAGTEAGDEDARTDNIRQIANYILQSSFGNAFVVFGDTNSRYTRTLDNIPEFLSMTAATDAWVKVIRNGVAPVPGTSENLICNNPSLVNTCETVDKIFYRSSKMINLDATHWEYASTKFLQPSGAILSDHNPVSANIKWTLAPTRRASDLFGGPHGTWFNDIVSLPDRFGGTWRVASITFRGGSRLDNVAISFSNGVTLSHGGSGGNPVTLVLNNLEYWNQATLCKGTKSGNTRNFYIKVTTTWGRTVQVGSNTGDCQNFAAPPGWQIVGYFGQAGDEMDQLGFYYAPQP